MEGGRGGREEVGWEAPGGEEEEGEVASFPLSPREAASGWSGTLQMGH